MSKSNSLYWLLAAEMALVSAAAVAQDVGHAQRETFIVEIDVFSGRPNPQLVLDEPAEVKAFAEKVKEACERASPVGAAAAAESPAVLGYRGLSVSRTLGGEAALSFVVGRGSMRMAQRQAPLACQPRTNGLAADAAGDLHLAGAGAELEAYVAQVALQKGVISRAVYQAIIQQLAR